MCAEIDLAEDPAGPLLATKTGLEELIASGTEGFSFATKDSVLSCFVDFCFIASDFD